MTFEKTAGRERLHLLTNTMKPLKGYQHIRKRRYLSLNAAVWAG